MAQTTGAEVLERRRAEVRELVAQEGAGLEAEALRLRRLERELRAIEGEVLHAISDAQQHGVLLEDGHRTATSWARAQVRWSRGEALGRMQSARLAAAEPLVAHRLAEGRLGVAQVRLLGRVRANPRCGDQLTGEVLVLLLDLAEKMPYEDWLLVVEHWVRLADPDGAHRDHERAHQQRGLSVRSVGARTELRATFGNVQGAQLAEVIEAFARTELQADLDEARERTGDDDPPRCQLARTARQRRADALVAALTQAADGGGVAPTVSGGGGPTVNVLVDHETLTQAMDDAATGRVSTDGGSRDPRRRRCVTDRGFLLDPLDALAALWAGHVRRVVLDGAGVVIDLGRRQRLFTGSAREAVWLQGRTCLWPGCDLDAHQVDHSAPWSEDGRTNPSNGGPTCGWHNRWKHRHAYRTWRDADGHWHVSRPDGTELTPI